jgi:hypothetical protein
MGQAAATNGDSVATQKQQITGYAMMKGWEVAAFFIDGGVSGSVPLAERPRSCPPLPRTSRDLIRERIRDVKRHLASQGIYNGGKRAFGYNVVDNRLVPNRR